MKVAVTGHRPNKLNNEYGLGFNNMGPMSKWVYEELEVTLLALGRKKITSLISGVALGVDMIFASLALRTDTPLIAAVPFKGQELAWPVLAQAHYEKILKHPLTTIHIVSEGGYAAWKMQKRNEWMVDNCDILIAVWNEKEEGGTWNCIKYAKSKNKRIIYISLKDYEE